MANFEYNDKSFYLDDNLKRQLDKNVFPELSKEDKDILFVIDGKERCLSKDTLIKTSNGDKTIEELYKLGKSFIVESLDLDTRLNEQSKAGIIKTGNKEVFEIETEDGRKVKATKEHTFFILRNNKIIELPLYKLKEGDKLICD